MHVCSRLAVIDGVGGDSGVKPQHHYATCPPLSSTGTACTQDCYARMNQCFVLFAGSEHSMCNDAQSRLAASGKYTALRQNRQVVMSDRAE